MVNPFEFVPMPRILFGSGKLNLLPEVLKKQNASKVLIITGGKSLYSGEKWPELSENLRKAKIEFDTYKVAKEPTPTMIDECVQAFRDKKIDYVVAIGGGSVMDAGKAISAMLKHPKGVKHYLEGVGDTEPTADKVPFIACPATSGTGSEATKNAVITEIGPSGFKKSLRHDTYIPDLCIVDPELTLTCPPSITASSGMDAFTQLLESYISTHATPVTDGLAIHAMEILIKSLPIAVNDGINLKAREGMAYAALISGVTLANAGLGLVHGFASAVGGLFNIPHGVVCGTLMGATNRYTVKRIYEKQEGLFALDKYEKVGRLFKQDAGLSQKEVIDDLLLKIDTWTREFDIPNLGAYGVTVDDIDQIIAASGNKYNPIALDKVDMASILKERI